ncbi:cyclophilin type peptidyl-prolyl cis-trans isomerase/CLD [Colletotrichum graminicola M1.001]|uniref:peptidylprolyl isomerase n=1 Tax=Colletotrichum graminicola (strain M1.001 / M2 / FGSC 10212) TaxID=645133 RepID=E3QGD4_COLGM|nr:cyclophilin type peptidyl-prolyl cis-trans isomerase/CLD [Colletotrichum graminicola M1.001]EFQ29922.1 cyclophilin type peptidyl-prolyl cis-trans isomerase/CLD [Colletotrichum graminicola M1.001]
MSAIYNLEPQPTASVILHTTLGDISVELFAKQTPLTCRNFLQLALDGYYDNTIFHRLVPGFILQGGDPTGTGNGGESIYDGGAFGGELDPWPMDERRGHNAGPTGIGFKDEFHSRLKWNRRGQLGMANESKPDTNGSQFFFTLDKADELNNKNTLFGRVAGDTIYNLAKMGEAEVTPGTDRPTYPVKITSIEILVNPFEDMVKRTRVATQAPKTVPVEKKKKRKGGKQLLSFGDDEGDAEEVPVLKKTKYDTRIVMDVDDEEPAEKKPAKAKSKSKAKVEKVGTPETQSRPDSEPAEEQKTALPKGISSDESKRDIPIRLQESPPPEPEVRNTKSALERTNEEIAALKASMKRSYQPEPVKETRKSALESMIPETSIRGRRRRPGGNGNPRDDQQALDFLKAFKSKLEQAPEGKSNGASSLDGDVAAREEKAGDEEAELCDLHFIADCQSCKAWDQAAKEDSDDEGWMSRALSFKADKLGKDLSYRKKAEEELVVIDPREKARTLQEEKKASREARSGNSGREWDKARNSKMARASALAGRGAR